MHVLDLAPLGVEHQHPSTPTLHVRIEERTGRAYLHLEALSHDRLRISVEENRDLVTWRVLELLDHQLAAARGRRPVHTAQGFALRVFAHAVQLDAAVPAQEQSLSVMRAGAGLAEERPEVHEPRIDEQSARGR